MISAIVAPISPQQRITTLLLLVAMVCTTREATLKGKVIIAADGDSITLLDVYKNQHRIRNDGIEAREGATVQAAIE